MGKLSDLLWANFPTFYGQTFRPFMGIGYHAFCMRGLPNNASPWAPKVDREWCQQGVARRFHHGSMGIQELKDNLGMLGLHSGACGWYVGPPGAVPADWEEECDRGAEKAEGRGQFDGPRRSHETLIFVQA